MEFTMFYGFNQRISAMGFEKAILEVKELGFSSVELLGNTNPGGTNVVRNLLEAKYLRSLLDQHGVYEACYSVVANFWDNPKAEEDLKLHIEIAAELGSPYVHHTVLPGGYTPETGGPSREDAIKKAVECSVRVADYAKDFGITCLYEDQGNYANGVKGFGDFYNEVKKSCSNVGVCADLGNILFVDEEPQPFIETYIQDVRHVHIKDYLRKYQKESPGERWMAGFNDSWMRDTVVGDGVIDVEACIKILKDAGYNGCFAFENGHKEPYLPGTQQAMYLLNKYWNQ